MDARARGYEDFGGIAEEFTSQSRPSWTRRPTAPHGAPNVVVILVDDLGFSDLGPFGSEIETPHVDRLAADGWVFTGYHTAPMCSPSRAALLTGLNPHRAGFGYVAHIDPGYPGMACELPAAAPTLPESLRAGGYATFMVGKWHLTVESRLHDGADRSSWPLQRGFDRYYGSMDGFTSLHHPHRLIRDNSPVEISDFPDDYYLTDDLTDRAIDMIDDLRASDATRPFFLYFAHTAVHGPVQSKPQDRAKYRGRYADGWNRVREERFRRQRRAGIVTDAAVLPSDDLPDAADIPAWDDLSDDDRALFARHMEAYAAAVDAVDQSIGRLLARLDELGERENTIIVVTSDNGGTAEGGLSGTRSYFAQFGVDTPLPDGWVSDVPRDPDLIGGPRLFSHYPAGWARVSNTPFRSFKSSTYEGGVHAPLIVSWPAGAVGAATGIRSQFAFVSDLAPTLLELTGVARPVERDGRPALEPDGRSLVDVLRNPAAPGRAVQAFECVGRRAIYDNGLKALSPVPPTARDGGAGGVWELYDLRADPTETRDLAAREPGTVAALAERWRAEAWRNTVFPLDDDGTLHSVRPDTEEALSRPVSLRPFRVPLERFRSAKLTVLRSFRVEIDVDAPDAARGTLVAHGDQGGGYALRLAGGALELAYNAYGVMHRARSTTLPTGLHRIELSFDEEPDLRWRVTARAPGAGVAIALEPVPMLLGMAPFTGISVGYDYGSPVDWERYERSRTDRFHGGTLHGVRYVPGPRSPHDHAIVRAIDDAVSMLAD